MKRAMTICLLAMALAPLSGCGPRGMAGIEIRPKANEIMPLDRRGKSIQFSAGAVDKNGLWVSIVKPSWTSSDDSVVTVDVTGNVTAVGSGKAEVTATLKQLTAKVPLEVSIVAAVELDPAEPITLKLGEERQFKALVKDDRGKAMPGAKVTWTMQGYAADVNQGGLVRGQAVGEAVLLAQSSHESTRIKITVVDR